MERGPDGRELLQAPEIWREVENDAATKDGGPAPGWDAFEIWRTRVKQARDQRPRIRDKTPA